MAPISNPVVGAKPASDDVFAEIAELGAQLCGARFAAITLHDGARHRALATYGGLVLPLKPGDSRFCCEVLHSGAPLEVSDARFDLRFHEDPIVAGGPRVRFYSGVPLLARDGRVAGTLSVFDVRAKALTRIQREALWKLADVVMRLVSDIDARRVAEATLSMAGDPRHAHGPGEPSAIRGGAGTPDRVGSCKGHGPRRALYRPRPIQGGQ
jgi:GAF domain-containing protein